MKMGEDAVLNQIFVREVEKRRCLYDYTSAAHADKELQDQKWQEIADIILTTVDECKSRWKNLRGGFTRYLNKPMTASGARHVKKYYLFDDMQFLLPFTRTRQRYGIQDTSSNHSDSELFPKLENDTNDQLCSDFDIDDKDNIVTDTLENGYQRNVFYFQDTEPENRKRRETIEENESVPIDIKVPKKAAHYEDPFGEAVKMYFAKKMTKKKNPDLDFFKSILPDLADFNSSQKILFKQKVLEAINQIAQGT